LQLAQPLEARIRPDVVVHRHAAVFDEKIAVETLLVCLDGIAMTRERELVLVLPGNLPALRRDLHAFAHRQPGARLDDAGQHGLEVLRPQPQPRRRALAEAPPARAFDQDRAETFLVDDRDVADAVRAAADARVDRADRDLGADRDRGGQARAAGAMDVAGGSIRSVPGR